MVVGAIKYIDTRWTSRATVQLDSPVAAFEAVLPVPVDHQEVVLGPALADRPIPAAIVEAVRHPANM